VLPATEYYTRLLYLSVAVFFALLLIATLILVLTLVLCVAVSKRSKNSF
jgi:hypothetical protein